MTVDCSRNLVRALEGCRNTVGPAVATIRALQEPQGHVPRESFAQASGSIQVLQRSLPAIFRLVGAPGDLEGAFHEDFDRWMSTRLEEPPRFDATLATYRAINPGEASVLVAPLMTPNGPPPRGAFLECVLYLRSEPEEVLNLMETFPGAKDAQRSRLLWGSSGFAVGNCLVVFPENIYATQRPTTQRFAVFLLNKFPKIWSLRTVPLVRELFPGEAIASAPLDDEEVYRARCLWAFAHDSMHESGARPLRENLELKMGFFPALLDEIRVDCDVAALTAGGDLPFSKEIREFILFERMLRLPRQCNVLKNPDAAAGILMFQWLMKGRFGLTAGDDGDLRIDQQACVPGLIELANEIRAVERTRDESDYLRAAEEFVREFLPEGDSGNRFRLPTEYEQLVARRLPPEGPLLEFFEPEGLHVGLGPSPSCGARRDGTAGSPLPIDRPLRT